MPAEEASEGGSQPSLPELPYHRFSNGDGILLVSTLPNGELPRPDPSRVSRFPQRISTLEEGRFDGMQLIIAHLAMPSIHLSDVTLTSECTSSGACHRHCLWFCNRDVTGLLDAVQGMDSYASFEGTILEVRRTYIRVVFSRAASDRMEARPARGTWRVDRYSPETTYQRQLKVKQQRPCIARAVRQHVALLSAMQDAQVAVILCRGHS